MEAKMSMWHLCSCTLQISLLHFQYLIQNLLMVSWLDQCWTHLWTNSMVDTISPSQIQWSLLHCALLPLCTHCFSELQCSSVSISMVSKDTFTYTNFPSILSLLLTSRLRCVSPFPSLLYSILHILKYLLQLLHNVSIICLFQVFFTQLLIYVTCLLPDISDHVFPPCSIFRPWRIESKFRQRTTAPWVGHWLPSPQIWLVEQLAAVRNMSHYILLHSLELWRSYGVFFSIWVTHLNLSHWACLQGKLMLTSAEWVA